MRKEWILTDEEKHLKRQKIVRNRMLKQQARNHPEHVTTTDIIPIHEVRFSSITLPSFLIEDFFLAFIIIIFVSSRTIS